MDDETLLAVIYRGRPATIEAVADLTHQTAEAARGAVDRLRERGVLGGDGEDVRYVHPAAWAAGTVADQSQRMREEAARSLVRIEDVVASLPSLLRDWAVGETSGDPVPVYTRHGPHASEDLWFEIAPHDTGTLYALLPEVDRFLEPDPERAARFGRALAGKDAVRVIMPTWAGDNPAALRSVEHYERSGVQYRLLDQPASWFWVDGDLLAVPFEWGEGRPTSVLCVRNASLAGMARDYFEQLWSRAASLEPPEHPWASLLVLMRQGTTLDTASRILGINPRTGRRRIAAAMEHYGVSTLFALGVMVGTHEASVRPGAHQG
ncbi:hypothetical protein GCM10010988_25660 [Cnuibacter physcomitrellae]|uniref:hypothetical protein n=1 Tax=Cnuibacter physcomitrellae TaxID=1619308 RepID=UPI0012F4AB83|nr:hypothetical protein [Cnuibacter physcomitrellae]GGI39756.1 hypothetical protein GCM10010988_25660 [Cnuibacter physcomitrellae]